MCADVCAVGDAVEFADILALASFPNVYMKLSGLGHFADDAPLYESALPFTSQVIAAFGAVSGRLLGACVEVSLAVSAHARC